MQTSIELIKELLAKHFNKTVRLQPAAQMAKTEFKANTDNLIHSDLDLFQTLREEYSCEVEVKRSGTGLVVIVIY